MESDAASAIDTDLAYVSRAIETQLQAGEPEAAAALARVILLRYPRHLATYQRLLRAAWMLRRWQEGEEWARRLLQADPGNALAWRSLAYAVEQKELRGTARGMWRRAFEADPYEPDTRAGLSRTSLEQPGALVLNPACLATLYLHSGRWAHAAAAFRGLVQANDRRLDFQVNLMAALWQQNARQEAYRLARHLTQRHTYLLLAWVVLSALGDIDDKALARNPINQMDPDGDFVRGWLGLPYAGARAQLQLTAREAALVAEGATG